MYLYDTYGTYGTYGMAVQPSNLWQLRSKGIISLSWA